MLLPTPPTAAFIPVCSTLNPTRPLHSSRPYLDRLSTPSSCTSQVSPIPLCSGVASGKRCQAVVQALEPPYSTYPTTIKHRDQLPCAICSPLARTAACRLADSSGACPGCGCDGRIDISTPSSPLKSGSPVRSAQVMDAARKSHSSGRPEAARASRTVDLCIRAPGRVVSVLSTCRVGDHGSLWQ